MERLVSFLDFGSGSGPAKIFLCPLPMMAWVLQGGLKRLSDGGYCIGLAVMSTGAPQFALYGMIADHNPAATDQRLQGTQSGRFEIAGQGVNGIAGQ